MTNNHRIVTGGDDWMRDIERRLTRQERRPAAANLHDLYGPGIGMRARQVADWSDPEVLRNGWYFSETFSINSPDPVAMWLGTCVVTYHGHGIQQLWSHGEAISRGRVREFHWHNASQAPTFAAWRGITTVAL